MTEKQYQRVVAIYRRLEALQEVLNFHRNSNKNILTYAHKNCNGDYKVHPSWATMPISSLLDKHDAMICQEIAQEMESLKKEIEKL